MSVDICHFLCLVFSGRGMGAKQSLKSKESGKFILEAKQIQDVPLSVAEHICRQKIMHLGDHLPSHCVQIIAMTPKKN